MQASKSEWVEASEDEDEDEDDGEDEGEDDSDRNSDESDDDDEPEVPFRTLPNFLMLYF